jgi:hypothetical protein
MLKNKKTQLFVLLIFLLNIGIYLIAFSTETADRVFAECARNSGRTAAAINLILLLLIGHFGLKTIYKEKNKFSLFELLITLFAVNHLIHFFFVYQNFNWHKMELNVYDHLHGFITFISLILLPIIVHQFKRLSKFLYCYLIIYFFNVTYFIGISFYARFKPGIDEAYLHRIGIFLMIIALFYVVFRVVVEMIEDWSTTSRELLSKQ